MHSKKLAEASGTLKAEALATTPLPSKSKRKDSVAEILLMKHLDELNLNGLYVREYRFHPERKWRFDFAILKLGYKFTAIELEGGAWTQGRHTRGKGFEADIRKYNEAARLGWTVIRFTPNMIERGESKAFLAELFGAAAPVCKNEGEGRNRA